MTRAEMREKRIAKWTQLIQEAQDSGLTIKGWCKEHGILEKTFLCNCQSAGLLLS